MTSLPPNADELVSAYIDGQAAPDEIELVESNPEMLALAEQMRTVSSRLAAPLAVDPSQKQAHLDAALNLFDELMASDAVADSRTSEHGPALTAVPTGDHVADPTATDEFGPSTVPETTSSVPGVTSLTAARERRRRRFSPGLIAAAMAAVLFIVIAAFGFGGSSTDDVASDSAEFAVESADDAADEAMDLAEVTEQEAELEGAGSVRSAPAQAAPEPAADSAESFAVAEAPLADADDAMDDAGAGDVAPEADAMEEAALDEEDATADDAENDAAETTASDRAPRPLFLGSYTTVDDLIADVSPITTDLLLEEQALVARPGDGSEPVNCQDLIPELADLEQPTLFATAELDGELVEVHVEPSEVLDEPLDIIVTSASSCEQLTP